MKHWKHSRSIPAVTAIALSALAFGSTGCTVVEGIFKAGLWVGVLVIGVIALAVFGIASLLRR